MTSKIHMLSEETINQIAAGEVIENPASVVKELIENSLDAGASQVIIELVGGGFQLIRISDDGNGMSEEDARLSIQRHATSKIVNAKDLFHLTTLGFRGEALASIAAISKMELMTAQPEQAGVKLEIEAGKLLYCEPYARKQGTTIEVRSLFFNVPVRKKFQKSPSVCSAEIFKTITILALSHPHIGFELISKEKKILQVQRQGQLNFFEAMKHRALDLLGSQYANAIIPLSYQLGSLNFEGIFGLPSETRPNRSGQYLFINQRAVTCPLIQEAIEETYGFRIANHRFPIYLLHLTIPSDLVDANVHPQKKEIRLRDERYFKERIHEALSYAFQNHGQLTQSNGQVSQPSSFQASENIIFEFKDIPLRFQEVAVDSPPTLTLTPAVNPLGIFSHYLILEGGSLNPDWDGIALFNLHAARWRIAYEQLLHAQGTAFRQCLLVPMTVELSSVDNAMVLTHLDAIEDMGFSLRPIGKNTFIVEALPPFLEEKDLKETIQTLAQGLQEFIGKAHVEKERQQRLAYLTSRFSKEKKQFHLQEALLLYHELQKMKDPFLCPKGSPILIHVSQGQIEQLFNK